MSLLRQLYLRCLSVEHSHFSTNNRNILSQLTEKMSKRSQVKQTKNKNASTQCSSLVIATDWMKTELRQQEPWPGHWTPVTLLTANTQRAPLPPPLKGKTQGHLVRSLSSLQLPSPDRNLPILYFIQRSVLHRSKEVISRNHSSNLIFSLPTSTPECCTSSQGQTTSFVYDQSFGLGVSVNSYKSV